MKGRLAVAIVDNVGSRAGMDYYDLGLLEALSRKGARTFLFSNFTSEASPVSVHVCFDTKTVSSFVRLLSFVKGHIQAYRRCRKEKIGWVILHLFATSWDHLCKVAAARHVQSILERHSGQHRRGRTRRRRPTGAAQALKHVS